MRDSFCFSTSTCLIVTHSLAQSNDKESSSVGNMSHMGSSSLRKVSARLSSGVRFGLGFLFERSCGPECSFCIGSAFHRKCRYFSFRPHFEVKMEIKDSRPELKVGMYL